MLWDPDFSGCSCSSTHSEIKVKKTYELTSCLTELPGTCLSWQATCADQDPHIRWEWPCDYEFQLADYQARVLMTASSCVGCLSALSHLHLSSSCCRAVLALMQEMRTWRALVVVDNRLRRLATLADRNDSKPQGDYCSFPISCPVEPAPPE